MYCSAAAAQEKNNWQLPYLSKDSIHPDAWLVNIKPDSLQPFLQYVLTEAPLRRLSTTAFIISGNEKQHLAVAGFAAGIWPAGYRWKLSPRLLQMEQSLAMTESGLHDFCIGCSDADSLKKIFMQYTRYQTTILYEYEKLLQVRTSYAFIQQKILPDKKVVFIDIIDRAAKEEVSIADFDNSLNTVNTLQNDYPQLDGSNTVVSVKENRPDTADIDFSGRWTGTPAASSTLSSHATIMSTMIAGGGNSFFTAKGVAPGAQISSSSFAILLPDKDAFYQQYKISVQNHSYGTGIENFYGADAAAYDASVNSNPSLLHVFSSGNAGDQTAANGQYAGINGYANLTGSFKMAKNIITVGSVDSFAAVPLLSSKGPAYDGRVKPDMMAFGEDGSSGAAALVSGTALVLQQVYKEMHAGALPDAALVKAVLLNTAIAVNKQPISFAAGYGNLNAQGAAATMKAGQFFTASLTQGQVKTFSLSVPVNTKKIKILLAWTDVPATANAFTALVNDLDLTVTHAASGQQWLPWVLNAAASKDSLQLPPRQKRDSLNNIEQVTVEDPLPGNYSISVQAHSIPAGTQNFYVVYQMDSANTFRWTWPTKSDNLLPGKQQVLRWQTNDTGDVQIEFRYAGTSNWQTAAGAASLVNNYQQWSTPDTNAVMQLRAIINGQQFTSDSFTLSAPLQMGVGFNCPDTVLLFWNKRSTAAQYQVYALGAKYMLPAVATADTSILINKKAGAASWYGAAPLLDFNKTGLRSLAINYNTQGVACYLSNFTADLSGNTARLVLALGSSFRIIKLVVEKADRNGSFKPLQSFQAPVQLQYSLIDNGLTRGINRYRVRIELLTGQVIYSDIETVTYLAGTDYIIYPNPVTRPQAFTVVSADLGNQLVQLFNAVGQKVYEQKMTDLSISIDTGAMAKGLYFYLILKDGKVAARGKMVVQ